MVDITDVAYRHLCLKAGAALTFTEMVYIDALINKNKKTLNMIKMPKIKCIKAIQITGDNLKHFEKAIPLLKKFDLINLNCGCPSTKIIGTKAGSYLLNNPEKIAEIIKILKKTKKPISVKIRLGFRKNNLLEIAKTIEEAGADMLTIHARLATQGYNTPADWNEIKKVKKIIKIPIIGNGDILTPQDAEKMLEICDGAMIARGVIGNPLIFKQTLNYLKTNKIKEIKLKENLNQLKQYLILTKKYKIDNLKNIKIISLKFLRNFEGASKIRIQISLAKSIKEIKRIINSIQNY